MSDYSIISWVLFISVVAGAIVAMAIYLIDKNAERLENHPPAG
jgi:hypothetical protein